MCREPLGCRHPGRMPVPGQNHGHSPAPITPDRTTARSRKCTSSDDYHCTDSIARQVAAQKEDGEATSRLNCPESRGCGVLRKERIKPRRRASLCTPPFRRSSRSPSRPGPNPGCSAASCVVGRHEDTCAKHESILAEGVCAGQLWILQTKSNPPAQLVLTGGVSAFGNPR